MTNKQRGFALMTWGYALAGVFVLSLMGSVYVQTVRLGKCKAEAALYVEKTKAEGVKARQEKQDQEMRDKLNLEKADATKNKTIADLRTTVKRLRDSRPSGGTVPPASSESSRPDLAAFDRAEFERAYGKLVAGVRGIADTCSEAVVDLDVVKQWDKERVQQ